VSFDYLEHISSTPVSTGARIVAPAVSIPQSVPGSIRPLVARRRIIGSGPAPSSREFVLYQRRKLERIRSLRTLGSRKFAEAMPAVRRVLGAVHPHALAFGATGTDEGRIRSLLNRLYEAEAELDDLMPNPRERLEAGVGLATSRAGELASSLGLDVAPEDLAAAAHRQLEKVVDAVGMTPWQLLSDVGLDRIATEFRLNDVGLDQFSALASKLGDIYEGLLSEADPLADCWRNAQEACEGGFRSLMDEILGDAASGATDWLTPEAIELGKQNISRWVEAADSSSRADWLMAAGGTVMVIGASVGGIPGAIISAVGALISLIGSIFGVFEEPFVYPPVHDCYNGTPWSLYPEAYAVMALGYVLTRERGQFENADIITQNRPSDYMDIMRGRADDYIARNLSYAGWAATVDDYTGEIMVSDGLSRPFRRLLDVFDRRVFVGDDREYNNQVLRTMEYVCRGCGIALPTFGHNYIAARNCHLWCNRHDAEVTTAFIGCEQNESPEIMPFRFDDGTKRSVPDEGNTEWFDLVGRGMLFSQAHLRSLILSAYLGGTLPYGVCRMDDRRGIVISTAVGGRSDTSPGGSRRPWSFEAWKSREGLSVPDNFRVVMPTKTDPREQGTEAGVSLEDLPYFLDERNTIDLRLPEYGPTIIRDGRVYSAADDYGTDVISAREFHRIPRATPRQYGGGIAAVTPGQSFIDPSTGKAVRLGTGEGDGISTPLVIGGVAAAAIGAYLLLK
jgi:hypothetical protein